MGATCPWKGQNSEIANSSTVLTHIGVSRGRTGTTLNQGITTSYSLWPRARRSLDILKPWHQALRSLLGLVGDAGWLQCGFIGHFWCQRGGFEANFGAKGVALRSGWCQSDFIDSLIHCCIASLVASVIQGLIDSLIHCFIDCFIDSGTHGFDDSLLH